MLFDRSNWFCGWFGIFSFLYLDFYLCVHFLFLFTVFFDRGVCFHVCLLFNEYGFVG